MPKGQRRAACLATGLVRSRLYGRPARVIADKQQRRPHHRALSPVERQAMLDILHEARFVDQAPAEIYAILLDEGRYLCSIRTMYRILAANAEVRERRNQRRHPVYTRPELLATGPNEVWSWDITKLKGPAKGQFFNLYVILDIFSRYIVGWMLSERENAGLATRLIEQSYAKHGIRPGSLTLHADRGSPMMATSTAVLLVNLGVVKSHSRPQQSNDNPYSESQFKTMKYCPTFPKRFGSIQDARAFCVRFFQWYNHDHHHSGIGLMTPWQVHCGQAHAIREARLKTLQDVYAKYPQRFVRTSPQPPKLPDAAWINPPEKKDAA
jgi:putative transposase